MDPVTAGLLISGASTLGKYLGEEFSASGRARRDYIQDLQSKLESGKSLGFSEAEKRQMLSGLTRQAAAQDKNIEAELMRGAQGGVRSGSIAKAIGELAGARQAALAQGYGGIEKASADYAAKEKQQLDRLLAEDAATKGQFIGDVAAIGAGAAVQGAGAYQDKMASAAKTAKAATPYATTAKKQRKADEDALDAYAASRAALQTDTDAISFRPQDAYLDSIKTA